MKSKYYKLVNRQVVPCPDIMEFALWLEKNDTRIGVTNVNGFSVSTIFIGMNANYLNKRNPLLFESMIFEGKDGKDIGNPIKHCERCSTWEEAVEQHVNLVYRITTEMDIDLARMLNIGPDIKEQVFSGAKSFVDDLLSKIMSPA